MSRDNGGGPNDEMAVTKDIASFEVIAETQNHLRMEGELWRSSPVHLLKVESPREVFDAPSLSVFKRHLDNALNNML